MSVFSGLAGLVNVTPVALASTLPAASVQDSGTAVAVPAALRPISEIERRGGRLSAIPSDSLDRETGSIDEVNEQTSGEEDSELRITPLDLYYAGQGPLVGSAAPLAPMPPPRVGVFTTTESLNTFPVAAGLVTVVWRVLAKVFPSWGGLAVVALVIALAIGTIIYIASDVNGTRVKDRVVAGFVALLNSFALAAAALGINSVT